MTQKTVLYILDPSKDITGAFMCARNEAILLEEDFDVILVLPSSSKISEENLTVFTKVLRIPVVNLRKSLGSLLLYLPSLIFSSWKLYRFMKRDNCLSLQINDYYLMHGVMLRIFGFRGKIVTWVRIDPTSYGSFFSKYWLKLDYRVSNAVISVSEFILGKLPVSSKNRLIYDPVRQSSEIKKTYTETNNKKLVYIGNYIQGKGQQYAIEAFARVAETFPEIELHFYGGDMGLDKNKKYKQMLQELAQKFPCSDRIVFNGFIKDTERVLQEGYMALNFSDSESFSMTCLEASAAGLSMVVTNSGGPQEIIVDGETGYLVEKGNVQQMADSIRDLLNNIHKNRVFGYSAARYVKEKFSEIKFKSELKDILKHDKK